MKLRSARVRFCVRKGLPGFDCSMCDGAEDDSTLSVWRGPRCLWVLVVPDGLSALAITDEDLVVGTPIRAATLWRLTFVI
jgi:hypothetical protein